jgi:hypothetical protein
MLRRPRPWSRLSQVELMAYTIEFILDFQVFFLPSYNLPKEANQPIEKLAWGISAC